MDLARYEKELKQATQLVLNRTKELVPPEYKRHEMLQLRIDLLGAIILRLEIERDVLENRLD